MCENGNERRFDEAEFKECAANCCSGDLHYRAAALKTSLILLI